MKIEGMNKKTGIKYRNFVIGDWLQGMEQDFYLGNK